MKIVTWNVFRHNKAINELIDYSFGYNPDVLCFQEVTESDLYALEKKYQGLYISSSKQFFIGKHEHKTIRLYNVIISKYELDDCYEVSHDYNDIKMPPRYRYSYSELDLSFVYVDVTDENGDKYRIFNAHFECVAPPSLRLKRIQQLNENFSDSHINIVAGDFNTFLNPLFSIAVAPVYGNFIAADFVKNERKSFRNKICNMGMKNPFHGFSTFKYFTGQYDYILIPKCMNEVNKMRIDRRMGSDHYGLFLEASKSEAC